MTTIDLGRYVDGAVDAGLNGRLCYLPGTDADVVVCPRKQLDEGTWICCVVARRHPVLGVRFAEEYLIAPVDRLQAGWTTLLADPDLDPDGYAMIWRSLIWCRWCSSLARVVAATLAHSLRQPGTVVVDLDDYAHEQLGALTKRRPATVHALLDRFLHAGLLRPLRAPDGGVDGLFGLVIPDSPTSLDGVSWR